MKRDGLQEIADRYNVILYDTGDRVIACGHVCHRLNCEDPRRAVEDALAALGKSPTKKRGKQ